MCVKDIVTNGRSNKISNLHTGVAKAPLYNLKNGSTQKFIAKRYGTTEANLHHFLKQRGLTRN
jgi:hypothetical protein